MKLDIELFRAEAAKMGRILCSDKEGIYFGDPNNPEHVAERLADDKTTLYLDYNQATLIPRSEFPDAQVGDVIIL